MSSSSPLFEELDIDLLARRCAEETERFFRKQKSQDDFCFELLRRALVLRNEAAWERIYLQYRTLIVSWVQRHPNFAQCNEEIHYFVNGAFARMWKWCTPAKFGELGTLPKVLAYFRACVYTEVSDHYREHVEPHQTEAWLDAIAEQLPAAPPPSVILETTERATFWRLVQERLQSEQERLLIEYHFVLGYKPREICALNRQAFADADEVYRVKENLLRRLRRDPSLRHFFPDDASL